MDLMQFVIFDLGWIFFAAWSATLATLSAIAFKHDILALAGAFKGPVGRS